MKKSKFLGTMKVQPFEFEFYADGGVVIYNDVTTHLVMDITQKELESVLQRGKQLLKGQAATLGEVSKKM